MTVTVLTGILAKVPELKIGYARVCTDAQGLTAQRDALGRAVRRPVESVAASGLSYIVEDFNAASAPAG